MSESNASTDSSQSTSTTSKPVTLQDVSGLTLAGNESSGTISITDGGAVQQMGNVSMAALEQAAEVTLGVIDRQIKLSQSTIDAVLTGQDAANKYVTGLAQPDFSAFTQMGQVVIVLAVVGGIVLIWKK